MRIVKQWTLWKVSGQNRRSEREWKNTFVLILIWAKSDQRSHASVIHMFGRAKWQHSNCFDARTSFDVPQNMDCFCQKLKRVCATETWNNNNNNQKWVFRFPSPHTKCTRSRHENLHVSAERNANSTRCNINKSQASVSHALIKFGNWTMNDALFYLWCLVRYRFSFVFFDFSPFFAIQIIFALLFCR